MFFFASQHVTTCDKLQTQLIQSQDSRVTHVNQKISDKQQLSWHAVTCWQQFQLSRLFMEKYLIQNELFLEGMGALDVM